MSSNVLLATNVAAFIILFYLITPTHNSWNPTAGNGDSSEEISDEDSDSSFGETSRKTRRPQKSKNLDIREILSGIIEYLTQSKKRLKQFAEAGGAVDSKDSYPDISVNRMRDMDPRTRECEMAHLPFEELTKLLLEKYNLSRDEISNISPQDEEFNTVRDACMKHLAAAKCDANFPYRRADGQCNNLKNPRWGSAMVCQERILPANYAGNSKPRLSVNGGPLPDARNISLRLNTDCNKPSSWTNMFVCFGQLCAHDVTLSPATTTANNEAIQCCPAKKDTHPQCMPISLPKDDPFYSKYHNDCMNFVRSVVCAKCSLGPRVPMDQVTSFIDCSFVYGISDEQTAALREYRRGLLRTQKSKYGEELLPSDPENARCNIQNEAKNCFKAGDPRVNQHSCLAILQTIFVREHNRCARELYKLNKHWDDERLFQECRRILGAIMQSIVYNEYLPTTIGEEKMSHYDLWTGDSTTYNRTVIPTMTVEFSTAAFRFGHTYINTPVADGVLNTTGGEWMLRNDFFYPFHLYDGYIDPLLNGSIRTRAQSLDRHLVSDVTNFLYRVHGQPYGLDLASFDVNRGRDHGLPTYVDMLKYCSKVTIKDFNDLISFKLMKKKDVKALKSVYSFVEDVDLWIALLMEIPIGKAAVGPTTACIIGYQFNRLKFGDRFYFEHKNEAGSFTKDQIKELNKFSLPKVICRNTNIKEVPKHPMNPVGKNNPLVQCSSLRDFNLSLWKTSKGILQEKRIFRRIQASF